MNLMIVVNSIDYDIPIIHLSLKDRLSQVIMSPDSPNMSYKPVNHI